MLKKLSIANFALIDHLDMDFSNGFTTITGETGAGKSIILGALKLVLGDRANLDAVKNKEKKCVIEACFTLNNNQYQAFFKQNDIDFEQETILRREILPSEKSRAFINDTPVNLSLLKELSTQLIDIHSQFNTTDLLRLDYQLEILDTVANNEPTLLSYKNQYNAYKKQSERLNQINTKYQEIQNQLDYHTFLLNELTEANLQENEQQVLEEQLQTLNNAQSIAEHLQQINLQINQENYGLNDQINQIQHHLQKLSSYSVQYQDINNRFESTTIELKDILQELSNATTDLDNNTANHQSISERLDLINHLQRKHQVSSIAELLKIQTKLNTESADYDQLEDQIKNLTQEIQEAEKQLNQLASQLNQSRTKAIPTVSNTILNNLSKMGMENSAITINIKASNQLKPNGKDDVEILFSANKGIKPIEIEKSVSGGERSRLMLSIKQLIASKKSLPTLILDEIDTGVSGKIADEMGKLMQQMANNSQIISITHLPQVAAKGKEQFKVLKNKNLSQTQVKLLTKQERLQEIAQLISGESVSKAAIQQAKELLG